MRNIDQCFEELEKKLGAKTTGTPQPITIECKRKWFRMEFDYLADDESVCKAWDENKRRKGGYYGSI